MRKVFDVKETDQHVLVAEEKWSEGKFKDNVEGNGDQKSNKEADIESGGIAEARGYYFRSMGVSMRKDPADYWLTLPQLANHFQLPSFARRTVFGNDNVGSSIHPERNKGRMALRDVLHLRERIDDSISTLSTLTSELNIRTYFL